MTQFKTKDSFQAFLDEAMFCMCGRLLTGFHMQSCSRIGKEWRRLNIREEKHDASK